MLVAVGLVEGSFMHSLKYRHWSGNFEIYLQEMLVIEVMQFKEKCVG